MEQRTIKRNTLLFIAFLLLGGGLHYIDPTESLALNSFLFCAVFAIYSGLILLWIHSVRIRLLPTRARTYMVASAVLMIVFLVIKVVKYRIVGDLVEPPFIERYNIYLYWTPQMLIPSLFLMACVRIRRGEEEAGKWDERLLLIPGIALSFMALTDDLHRLVYHPKTEWLTEFSVRSGTYTYGIGFYLLYAWMIIAWFAGLVILFRETGRRLAKGICRLAWIIGIWAGLLLLNYLVLDRFHLHQPYTSQDIHIFSLLGVFEVCIRSRLIPSNENHIGFFEQLPLPVMITDRDLSPVFRTKEPLVVSADQMKAALSKPVYPQEDTRLTGMAIRAGCAFWAEDESELHRENSRLASANELLSEENEVIRAENELKEKKAHLDARNQVYDRIAEVIRPRQKRIETLLAGTTPEAADFRRILGECCVLNVWCKRKSNLLLLDEAALPERNRELFLALQESCRYLKCCGVEAAATGEETADFPLMDIHDLYDTFESVIESWLPTLRRMTVSLLDDGIRIAVDAEQAPLLPETVLPVERYFSDGITFLTIRRKGGKTA